MDLAYKASLKRWALDHLSQRIATTTKAMRDAQDAANSEEKSSAGDKYETGRAMGHLQKEMHARQLAELVRELAAPLALSLQGKKAGDTIVFQRETLAISEIF